MFLDSLRRTRQTFFGRIAALLGSTELDEETWNDLEALLVQADVGVQTALLVTSRLKERVRSEGLASHSELEAALKETLVGLLPAGDGPAFDRSRLLTVILIVGANGSGKTTTVAKLAKQLAGEGWTVMLAAADTFRAAAIEQLEAWATQVGVGVVAGQTGSDPGAVVYDAIRAARARGCNMLLVDTAGRLHTKYNLMEELKKVRRVAEKNVHEAPHGVWLILDGTTGQNALAQARHFKDAVGVTGVIVTKLDSSARGGMVFAIGRELGLPVYYVGVGEGLEDLRPFSPRAFVDSLFE